MWSFKITSMVLRGKAEGEEEWEIYLYTEPFSDCINADSNHEISKLSALSIANLLRTNTEIFFSKLHMWFAKHTIGNIMLRTCTYAYLGLFANFKLGVDEGTIVTFVDDPSKSRKIIGLVESWKSIFSVRLGRAIKRDWFTSKLWGL